MSNELKIGDSDELITVTKSRWDAIQQKDEELRTIINEMNKGGCVFIETFRHRGGHGTHESFQFLTKDASIGVLTRKLQEQNREAKNQESIKDNVLRNFNDFRDELSSLLYKVTWRNKNKTRNKLKVMFDSFNPNKK